VPSSDEAAPPRPHHVASDVPFYVVLSVIGGTYVVLILAMLLADVVYALDFGEVAESGSLGKALSTLLFENAMVDALGKPEILIKKLDAKELFAD